MSKKVLILSGSPRKGGNSDYLCDKLAQGARDAGHDVEKILAYCFKGSIERSVICGHGLYEKEDARTSHFAADAYELGKTV